MTDIAIILACLDLLFTSLLGVYLTKSLRAASLKKRLRGAVTQFAAIPQANGVVSCDFMQDGVHMSRVQFTDRFGAVHFADIICAPDAVPEIGTPVLLRTAEHPVPQIPFHGKRDNSVFAMQDTLNKTGLVMTEQRWNEVLAMMTKQQKKLGRDSAIYGLMAAGCGLISALTSLALLVLTGFI